MQIKDFRLFVESHLIDEVVIQSNNSPWMVFAIGERVPSRFHSYVETAFNEPRYFSNLNTAYRTIRGAGWSGAIRIDG